MPALRPVPASALQSSSPSPGSEGLHLLAPWLNIGSWKAAGVDAQGRPHQARQAVDAHQTGLSVALPTGFSGSLDLADRKQAPLGRLVISKFGGPDFQARSRDLDVSVLASQEVLIARLSRPVRCYISLPLELKATSLLCKDSRTGESSQHVLPTGSTTPGSRGTSLDLPAQFCGHVEARDANGNTVVSIHVRKLGMPSDVQAVCFKHGLEPVVRANASMLDVSIQASKRRALIR